MSPHQSLLDKSLRAAGWGYAGSAIRLVMQIGTQVVLARLLGPHEYGLFAIGVILVALTFLFSDVASSALIQLKEVSIRQMQFAFFCQVTAGVLATMVLLILAKPISDLINQTDSYSLILAVAPICFINAFGGVALAQLRRELKYGIIQISQTAGYFVGYVLVGIPLAMFTNAGVWALVAAWVVQAVLSNIINWKNAPHSLRFAVSCEKSSAMISFGKSAMLANFSNWALANVDRLIVAKFTSTAEIGNYNTSMNLLATPLAQIMATFQSVTFSASSRLDSSSDENAFLPLVCLISLVTWCMYGFTFAVPDVIIGALYGPKWLGAVPYMQAFSVSLAAFGTMSAVTPLLWARGAVKREAVPQLVMVIVLAITTWIAAQQSPLVAAWAVAAVSILRCIWILSQGVLTFKVPVRELVSNLTRAGIFACILSFLCHEVNILLSGFLRDSIFLLLADVVVLIALVILGLYFRDLIFGSMISRVLDRFVSAIKRRHK